MAISICLYKKSKEVSMTYEEAKKVLLKSALAAIPNLIDRDSDPRTIANAMKQTAELVLEDLDDALSLRFTRSSVL